MKQKYGHFLLAIILAFLLGGCGEGGQETADTADTGQEETTEVQEETTKGESGELSFNPGSYVGTAEGYNGPIELEVTFSENEITDIEVVNSSETEHVGDVAYEIMFEDMVEANGSGVDLVSSATITSAAVRSAVNDAAEIGGSLQF